MKRARDICNQLAGLLDRVEIELTSNFNYLDAVRKSIISGFFAHSAKLQKNTTYRRFKHIQTVHIHPSLGLAKVIPRLVSERGHILLIVLFDQRVKLYFLQTIFCILFLTYSNLD